MPGAPLDPAQAPAEELIVAYHSRWEFERTIHVRRTPTGIVPLTDHPLTAITGNAHNVYIGSA